MTVCEIPIRRQKKRQAIIVGAAHGQRPLQGKRTENARLSHTHFCVMSIEEYGSEAGNEAQPCDYLKTYRSFRSVDSSTSVIKLYS